MITAAISTSTFDNDLHLGLYDNDDDDDRETNRLWWTKHRHTWSAGKWLSRITGFAAEARKAQQLHRADWARELDFQPGAIKKWQAWHQKYFKWTIIIFFFFFILISLTWVVESPMTSFKTLSIREWTDTALNEPRSRYQRWYCLLQIVPLRIRKKSNIRNAKNEERKS